MSAEQIAAAAVGGALLTAGIARRTLVRRAAGRALKVALRDPEPLVRAAAVQTAGENGIGRNARLLLTVAKVEQDIWVRQVIAETVNRHLWEPPAAKALVDLRIWAKQQVMWGQVEVVGSSERTSSPAGIAEPAGSASASDPEPGGSAAVAAGEETAVGGDGAAVRVALRIRPSTSATARGRDKA